MFRGTGDALSYEVHSVQAVGHVRIEALGAINSLARGPFDHIFESSDIDVGEGLEIPLGMAAGRTARTSSQRGLEGRIRIARIDLMRLAVGADEHFVRLLLMPFQRGLGAVHLDPNVVFPAMRDLR